MLLDINLLWKTSFALALAIDVVYGRVIFSVKDTTVSEDQARTKGQDRQYFEIIFDFATQLNSQTS